MRKIVVMAGGFHPFHAGHYALYKSAVEAFPDADVYVAATNDQKARPFPFSIKEKLAKLAGVAPGRFVQVKSPFKAEEVTSNYNPNEDVLIFVRSEKDKTEQPKPGGTKKDGTPSYFQPWTGKDVQPFSKHAYIHYLPTVEFGPGIRSATEIRNAWPNLNDRQKTAMVMSLYPATQKNPKLAKNVVQMLDMGMGESSTVSEMQDTNNFIGNANAAIKQWQQKLKSIHSYAHFIDDNKNNRIVARGLDQRVLGVFNRLKNQGNIFGQKTDEVSSPQQQAAIAISIKKVNKKPTAVNEDYLDEN